MEDRHLACLPEWSALLQALLQQAVLLEHKQAVQVPDIRLAVRQDYHFSCLGAEECQR